MDGNGQMNLKDFKNTHNWVSLHEYLKTKEFSFVHIRK